MSAPDGGGHLCPRSRFWPALAGLLACVQLVLLTRTAWDKSDTIDEPYFLESALAQWIDHDLSRTCDAPAFPRWGFALALRLVDPALFDTSRPGGRHPLWSRPLGGGLQRNLLAARATTILLTVAAGLFLWAAARSFGPDAALVTHALWCVSPTVLANGSLATLDPWAAAFLAIALWAAMRATPRPRAGPALLTGALVGLAAASKATALGALPVAAVVLGVAAWRAAPARKAGASGRVLLALTAGFGLALWCVYLFRIGTIDVSVLCGRATGLPPRRLGPFPFPAWIEGLMLQRLHGEQGHLSYLFGEVSARGWWWFYLAALALKATVGAQVLVVLRLVSWVKAPPPRARLLVDAALLAYPLLLLVVMSAGRAQNGIRYVLPAFPFLVVWGGRAVADARAAFGRRGVIAAGACVLAGAVESLAVHPHHLMFFNAWAGGPRGGPRYLVHGDDWGQDQRRLGEWQRSQRPWRLFYTPYNGKPEQWGITYETPSCQPQPGYYALHAVEVHRPKRQPAGCLDWLTVEPPDAHLGYSIYLYQVNRPRIERLAAQRGKREPFWQSGPFPGP